jgi:NADPH:quinone reductase-like Zn-dependent oxidoreductase/acyl carrier protein
MLTNPGWDQLPKLSIVTCGAQPAGSMASVTPAQAPVWGMSKVIALEHPDLSFQCIDLDPEASRNQNVEALLGELLASDQENLTAIREGQRMVPRLKRVHDLDQVDLTDTAEKNPDSVRLEKSASGILEELNLRSLDAEEPGPGQVQIRIHAAGLSFRDVMNALSMRDDPEPLGSECSGRIIKIGQGVNGLSIGDAVIALASGSIATLANANAEFVIPKPKGMSFEKAATLPTAFLTAHYALNHLGRICKGERVLIHAAAGGVGMAAVQFALAAGAEVYATAGNSRKRAYLRFLGVKQAMDSRTTEFKEKIMEATGGKGVNVILNSLAGEFIIQSLSALGPHGRFLEIGKRDILTPEQVHRLRPDVTYHIVDLALSSYENPALIHKLFHEVVASAEEETIRALPLRVFPLSQASSAFRFMSQSKHIGKIIIKNDRLSSPTATIHSDATYLITGGLSGLGLLVAQWLAEQGAKHLALMARSPAAPTVKAKISELEQKGVSIRIFQADVSAVEQVAFCLGEIDTRMPPLRGIIHSAGVLADSVLMNQTWEQFNTVYKPKIYGSWNLHTLTKEIDLDFFVLFSSTAGLLGSTGQSNHASANAFLDALSHHRRQIGLPAVSINWGVWSEVGSAAKKRADEWVALQGVGVITPQKGIQALERVLQGSYTQIAIVPVDWSIFLGKYAGGRTPAWLSGLQPVAQGAQFVQPIEQIPAKTVTRNVLDELSRLPAAKRRNALMDVVQDHIATVLGISNPAEIDTARPLNEQGVDSLIAVELRNMLGKGLGLQKGLPATLVFDYPTIETLTDFLFDQTSLSEQKGKRDNPKDSRDPDDLIDALEDLSDEAVDRLLREQAEGL